MANRDTRGAGPAFCASMRRTLGADHLCPCYTCQDDPSKGMMNPVLCMMILCPLCGNKRCPPATHHENPCTGSNEPGQPGSNYPKPNWPE